MPHNAVAPQVVGQQVAAPVLANVPPPLAGQVGGVARQPRAAHDLFRIGFNENKTFLHRQADTLLSVLFEKYCMPSCCDLIYASDNCYQFFTRGITALVLCIPLAFVEMSFKGLNCCGQCGACECACNRECFYPDNQAYGAFLGYQKENDPNSALICCGYSPIHKNQTPQNCFDNFAETYIYHLWCADLSAESNDLDHVPRLKDADLCTWRKDVGAYDPHTVSLATRMAREIGELASNNTTLVSLSYLTAFITLCIIFSSVRATGSDETTLITIAFAFEVATFILNFTGNLYNTFKIAYRNKLDGDRVIKGLKDAELPQFLTIYDGVRIRIEALANNYLTGTKTFKDGFAITISCSIVFLSFVVAVVGFILFFTNEETRKIPIVGIAAFGAGFGFSYLQSVFENAHKTLNSYILSSMCPDAYDRKHVNGINAVANVAYRYGTYNGRNLVLNNSIDEYEILLPLADAQDDNESWIKKKWKSCLEHAFPCCNQGRRNRMSRYFQRDTSNQSPLIDYMTYHKKTPDNNRVFSMIPDQQAGGNPPQQPQQVAAMNP